MKKLTLYLQRLLESFLLGNEYFAVARLFTVFAAFLVYFGAVGWIFRSIGEGLRYSILPAGALVCVILLSARYVHDIYNLKSYYAALRYITASFLGIGYPIYKLDHGKKEPNSDKLGLMETIGGPGYLHIYPGNVVLLERLQAPSGVYGSGMHFVPRFDRIKTIVDLEEQQHTSFVVEATTKDGIPIAVRNVYYHYRLLPGKNRERTVADPYPYSVKAVRDFAYNRSVTKDGLTHWENAVKLPIEGAISDYINSHQVDHITAPSQLEKDPRDEIAQRIRASGIQGRLKAIGTILTWFDIGSINAGNGQVDLQRLRGWQAKWNGQSAVVRAEGEAQRAAFQELGRVETQSDLLRSILNSFRNVQVSDKHKENVRKIVMARTAQLLDAMTSLNRNADGDRQDAENSNAGKGR